MSPKEKAFNLIEQFNKITFDQEKSKECAKIAAKELQKQIYGRSENNYYTDVLSEIDKY